MKKKILVTHNDLDGVGAAILFKHVCERRKYSYEIKMINVQEADSVLEQIYTDIVRNDNIECLYIVDLSPKDPTLIKKLSTLSLEKKDFLLKLLDHHETSQSRFNGCDWAKFDFSTCGTLLLYDELKKQGFNEIEKFKVFSEIVDDYDRFILSMENSLNMNRLFNLLNKDEFIDRCLIATNPAVFSIEESLVLKYLNKNNDIYINKKIDSITPFNINNANIAVIFADKLANEISMTMRERKMLEYDCVAVIDVSKNKVSLRHVKPFFNVGELASCFHQRGGGHIGSGGFALENFKTNIFIKEIFKPI